MTDTLFFDRVALIGMGLIGSSIAWALRQNQLAGQIIGYDSSEETRKTALRLGFVDELRPTAALAVQDADLTLLCIPVGSFSEVLHEIASVLSRGSILTDVGSVKARVIADVQPLLPQYVHFVPAHPIAGTEYSGPESGFASLFQNRWCILTPPEGTDSVAVEKILQMWRGFGSKVEVMSAARHDRILAVTSHLPHLIAFTIVGTASDLEAVTKEEVIKFSAGGFRDFTRIASSDPTMWRDIFLNNRQAVLELLGRFSEDLFSLQRAIRWEDGQALLEHFKRTRAIRRNIIDSGQDVSGPDFGRGRQEK